MMGRALSTFQPVRRAIGASKAVYAKEIAIVKHRATLEKELVRRNRKKEA